MDLAAEVEERRRGRERALVRGRGWRNAKCMRGREGEEGEVSVEVAVREDNGRRERERRGERGEE